MIERTIPPEITPASNPCAVAPLLKLEASVFVAPPLPADGTLPFGMVVVKSVIIVESVVKSPLVFVLTIKLVV